MAVQFVCFGLISLVSNKWKSNDSTIIFTIRSSVPGGNSPVGVRLHASLSSIPCVPVLILLLSHNFF